MSAARRAVRGEETRSRGDSEESGGGHVHPCPGTGHRDAIHKTYVYRLLHTAHYSDTATRHRDTTGSRVSGREPASHCVHTLTAEPALARFKVRCGDRVAGITETAQMRRGRAIACNMHHAQAEASRLSLPFLSSFAARVASARRRGTAQRARRSTTSPVGSRQHRRAV